MCTSAATVITTWFGQSQISSETHYMQRPMILPPSHWSMYEHHANGHTKKGLPNTLTGLIFSVAASDSSIHSSGAANDHNKIRRVITDITQQRLSTTIYHFWKVN